MHPQIRVHDATVVESRHSTRHCRVVQRLGTLAHLRLKFSVGKKIEVVVEKRIVVVQDYRGQRFSLDEAQGELESAN